MATHDLAAFAKRMDELADRVERNAPKAVGKVVQAISRPLVMGTPVDTSRARMNWQAAIGAVPSGTLFAYPDKPGSPEIGGTQAIANLNAIARQYKGGSYIAIANNLPYIQKLNQGWSAQAPAAFVQMAVMAGLNSLKGFRVLDVH